jgi:hypothetical protein
MTKSELKRKQRDRFKLHFRLPEPLFDKLKEIAEAEDRTMAYLARVFIKAGVDDRNRGRSING